MWTVLAQSATTKATQGEIVLWVAILIVTALLGGLLIMWVRRKILANNNPAESASLMDQLRGMLARGEITQEEFDATRKTMVKKMAASKPPAAAPSPPRPEHRSTSKPPNPPSA